MRNYTRYKLEDFLTDDNFLDWVKHPNKKSQIFWEQWMRSHPEKREIINQAREIILLFDEDSDSVSENRLQEVKQKIDLRVNQYQSVRFQRNLWLGAAACIVVLLVAGLWFVLNIHNSKTEWVTEYGETRTYTLPDKSIVTLNANSKLAFNQDWQNQEERAVWLEGEAFFEVEESKDTEDHLKKFVVHTSNMDVVVTGTKFNVNHRRGQTRVVLSSGKVSVIDNQSVSPREIMMNPGEMVEYGSRYKTILKKAVDPAIYTSWREHQLIFQDITLKEVAEILEDHYGVKVIFEDEQIAQKKFKGSVPSNNLEVLLTAFSKLYQVQITRKGNLLTFHKEVD